MKVVLHVLNSRSYSGAENVVITIMKYMKQVEGIRCIYISPKGEIKNMLEEANVEYYLVDRLTIGEFKRVLKLYAPDIIHAHDFTASLIASVVGRKADVISHLHCNPPWIRRWGIKTLLYNLACIKYKKILVVSDAIKDEMVSFKSFRNKAYAISNPIARENILSKVMKNDVKEYDLIFLGRLTQVKNPLMFLEIVRSIKNKYPKIQATMIGDGDLKEECNKFISNNLLEENVTLLGFQSNPYQFLNKARIMCVTSYWEGFGLMAVEGLTLGVPVIATGVGGLVDIVTDQCGKFCNEVEEFVEIIDSLLGDENQYKRYSEESYKRAEELENIPEYMKNILECYY